MWQIYVHMVACFWNHGAYKKAHRAGTIVLTSTKASAAIVLHLVSIALPIIAIKSYIMSYIRYAKFNNQL